jgi:hypothetical protein
MHEKIKINRKEQDEKKERGKDRKDKGEKEKRQKDKKNGKFKD